MTPDDKRQPLYVPPEERVTLDEIKQRAEQIQDLAVTQSKQVVHDVYEQNVTRAALVAVGVVVVVASLAYFVGARGGRRTAQRAAEQAMAEAADRAMQVMAGLFSE